MNRKTVSGIILSLLLTSMLTLAINIQPVEASGTIYIRADGSVDPPTAQIQRNGDVYTLTGNVTSDIGDDGIVIERDNMTLDGAGYIIQGVESGAVGIRLLGRSNVTVKNMGIKSFTYGVLIGDNSNYNNISGNDITANSGYGIDLWASSNNLISGNNITANLYGIYVSGSSNYNNFSRNNIMANTGYGVVLAWGVLWSPSYNSLFKNNIIANKWTGLMLDGACNYNNISENNIARNREGIWLGGYSNYNTISRNNITANNQIGLRLWESSNNTIYNNNFINNLGQVDTRNSMNIWDNGYPSGGNSWSNENPKDLYRGPHQNETGKDRIGDTPCILDVNNRDRYPLIYPYGYVPSPDLNDDKIVDIFDLVAVATAFGKIPGDLGWNPVADLIQDEIIDIFDLVMIAVNFGETYP